MWNQIQNKIVIQLIINTFKCKSIDQWIVYQIFNGWYTNFHSKILVIISTDFVIIVKSEYSLAINNCVNYDLIIIIIKFDLPFNDDMNDVLKCNGFTRTCYCFDSIPFSMRIPCVSINVMLWIASMFKQNYEKMELQSINYNTVNSQTLNYLYSNNYVVITTQSH